MALLQGKQIADGSIPNAKLTTPAGNPTASNKAMVASATTADGQIATVTTLAATPANHSYIRVSVNGLHEDLGDGVKTKSFYFSADSGTTARAFSAIAQGDSLYFNQSIAGYSLAATDRIDLDYNT